MIEAKDDKFWQLVDRDARVEKVAGGFQFTEGPVNSRRGYLLFSDIPAQKIHKHEAGKTTVFRENSNRANGLTFDHQGRLLACEAGRVTRTEKNGQVTVLASAGLEGPNDLVYAIDGSIYFSDLPKSTIYQITRTGELRPVAKELVAPNGVALSPNQQELLAADSKSRNIWRFRILPDGKLTEGRQIAPVRGDGLKTDESGNLWVAGVDGIWVLDREGKHLGTIKTPEPPSNCAWGDGFRGLYITARTSVYHVRTKVPGTRTF